MSDGASPLTTCLGVEHSMQGRVWQTAVPDEYGIKDLARTLQLPDAVARILVARGLRQRQQNRF